MKKFLKITAIAIVSLIVLLEVIPLAFKSKVNEVVKTEANKMLLAKVDFENLGISLLRHFPHASISLSGLTVIGIDKFEGDTLASIDKIELVVNLASLFSSKGYELTRLIVDEPMLNARKLEDGAVNWNVMPTEEAAEETSAEPEDSGSTAFKLQVKEVKIVDGQLSYVDDSSKMAASVDKLNLRLSGDLAADRTSLNLLLSLGAVNFTSGNINMLKDVAVKLDAEVDADLANSRFE
ncbi:MAG: AsmA family protein, partial [Rikenellaceae bacterium]|nr:AsmA family protein [Rikenellaceae bacterium]